MKKGGHQNGRQDRVHEKQGRGHARVHVQIGLVKRERRKGHANAQRGNGDKFMPGKHKAFPAP
jgi:hypothetical protein